MRWRVPPEGRAHELRMLWRNVAVPMLVMLAVTVVLAVFAAAMTELNETDTGYRIPDSGAPYEHTEETTCRNP